jgi:nucleotide-binding universal stress UspA family protein
MGVIDVVGRLRDEFAALPGLRLTEPQVERLCTADPSTSTAALRALVSAGVLTRAPDGSYGRTELAASGPRHPMAGDQHRIVPSPWRRILCFVDFTDDSRGALTPAARAALRYATTLAVAHRARITALRVVPSASSDAASRSFTDELRKNVVGEPFRGLIDVRVAIGPPNDALARVSLDVDADLIVIGRSDAGGSAALPPVSEMLRQVPCPVLIVHPSGRAAVA